MFIRQDLAQSDFLTICLLVAPGALVVAGGPACVVPPIGVVPLGPVVPAPAPEKYHSRLVRHTLGSLSPAQWQVSAGNVCL